MRAQREEALGGRRRAAAILPALLLVLFGEVSQLPLPLLLEKAFLREVVVAAEGQTPQGRLQVPAAGGPGSPGGPPVGVL